MFRSAIRLLLAMIFSPKVVWKELSETKDNNGFCEKRYLLPIFTLIALASFIGGYMDADCSRIQCAIKEMIVLMITVFGSLVISSYILNEYLSAFFPQYKGISKSRKFIAYASSMNYALYILVALLNDLFFLWAFSLYTVYLIYVSSFNYIKITEESQRSRFVAIASLLVLVCPLLIKNVIGHIIIKA